MVTRLSDIYKFFLERLPREELVYHSPLPPQRPFDPLHNRLVVDAILVSLTPTQGVYEALDRLHRANKRSAVFLHRPFRLDRRRVPHGTVVFASHVRYDELYTTGYNPTLAREYGAVLDSAVCIRGYKNDPDRRIGLVSLLGDPVATNEMIDRLSSAFGGYESTYAGDTSTDVSPSTVRAIACLNAFTPEVLDRVSRALEHLRSEVGASDLTEREVLCLTGAVREAGLEDAKKRGMSVVAVGHKRCEDWGMIHFERELKIRFPHLDVARIDEVEIVPPKVPRAAGNSE